MKVKTVFVCQVCGYAVPKWLGRCPDCDSWNSMAEERSVGSSTRSGLLTRREEPRSIVEIEATEAIRTKTGIAEFDRVLGGGVVPGSVVLVGGEPGIGKSTLLLQLSNTISVNGERILYVSGEESAKQTKLRANRLSSAAENLYIVNETNLDMIREDVQKLTPKMVVVDSIQVMYKSGLSSSPGSVSQVRECAAELANLAKSNGTSFFLVGHVTKEGTLAGPRVLEHIVDCVLYFEGARHASFRLLRAVKNRFGSTNEVAIFEMTERGLIEVAHPSKILLAERLVDAPGSTVVPTLEGTRPLLVEIQALTARSSFGIPKRRSIGLDFYRVGLLLAVLEKRVGLNLQDQDVYINVTGGIKVTEPAVDLGVAVAVASSFKEVPARDDTVVIGEVGLGGEVRTVNNAGLRVREAEKLGFKRCVLPKHSLKSFSARGNMEFIGVRTVAEAISRALIK